MLVSGHVTKTVFRSNSFFPSPKGCVSTIRMDVWSSDLELVEVTTTAVPIKLPQCNGSTTALLHRFSVLLA